MKRVLPVLIALFVASTAFAQAPGGSAVAPNPANAPQAVHVDAVQQVVDIGSGRIDGSPRDHEGVLSFKGIPYATPPIGQLRWAAPQPPTPWQGVRTAVQFGTRCISAWKSDPKARLF